MNRRLVSFLSLFAIVAGAATSIPAQPVKAADPSVKAGVLRCDVAGGLSFIFGSTRALECLYSPAGNYPSERYSGEIKKFGVDIGYVDAGVIIWTVVAPTVEVARGALAGTYVGASADVTAGIGLGANALFGGGKSVALQPVSITGSEGLNLAAGLSKVELRSAQ